VGHPVVINADIDDYNGRVVTSRANLFDGFLKVGDLSRNSGCLAQCVEQIFGFIFDIFSGQGHYHIFVMPLADRCRAAHATRVHIAEHRGERHRTQPSGNSDNQPALPKTQIPEPTFLISFHSIATLLVLQKRSICQWLGANQRAGRPRGIAGGRSLISLVTLLKRQS
jgi:hypothetical protein